VTAEVLSKAGIQTIADLQDHPGDLRALLGSFGPVLKRYARGEDDRALELGDEVKSISSETTFERDTADRPTLRAVLKEHADDISTKLLRRRLSARTVQVKVRYGDFSTLTRQLSVEEPLSDSREIYRIACWLLGHHQLVRRPLRLLGVAVSGLNETGPAQLVLPFGSNPGR
jgi:DNA polymerase-4